jgi:hypothetical protein
MKCSGAISIASEHFNINCLVCGKEFRAVQGIMRIAVFLFAENKIQLLISLWRAVVVSSKSQGFFLLGDN